jgi:hypothetical protein
VSANDAFRFASEAIRGPVVNEQNAGYGSRSPDVWAPGASSLARVSTQMARHSVRPRTGCQRIGRLHATAPRTAHLHCHQTPGGGLDSAVESDGGQGIAKQIEMTDVPGGLVDHVDEDPAKVDRSPPERRNRRDMLQRVALSDRIPTALAG